MVDTGPVTTVDVMVVRVSHELQVWLDGVVGCKSIPTAEAILSEYKVALMIGDTQIWSTEEDSLETLNFEVCKARYREHLLDQMKLFD